MGCKGRNNLIMCVVSMVGDHFHDKWNPLVPKTPYGPQPLDYQDLSKLLKLPPSKADYDALKKEVEEMKALLKRAIEYDRRNNEPECQIEEKLVLLRAVAKMMGVSLDDVFNPNKASK